ncbi:MAG: hypothetical protein ACXVFN_17620 [Solirubrobacteraceae bacterium]
MSVRAGEVAKRTAASLSRIWSRLDGEERLAAIAALALLASMLLPWYRKSETAVVKGRLENITTSLSAFGVYSFVEAAIFVVSLGVLGLLWARAERKAFHLPGGDGSVIMGAGLWTMFLVFYRQFDRPSQSGVSVDVSVNWGIFIAFILGAVLAYAGYRIRAAHRPEPLTDDVAPEPAPPAPRPRPAPDPDRTIVARRRPPADPDGQLSFDEPAEYRPPPK